jgi:hypothetical protein
MRIDRWFRYRKDRASMLRSAGTKRKRYGQALSIVDALELSSRNRATLERTAET